MSRRNGPNIVTNGLVLYLDAANRQSYVSGSTVWNDVSNNGNTGTLTNGPTFSSANGGSIVFDGVNDYVDCGNSSTLSFTQGGGIDIPFSINLWVYPTSYGLGALQYSMLVSKSQFIGIWTREFVTGISSTTVSFNLFVNNFNYIGIDGTTPLSLNTWSNVCFTYDGSKTLSGLKLYINSNLQTTTTSSAGTYTGMSNTGVNVNIGRQNNTGGDSGYLKGNIANTIIYRNKTLNQTEVLQNYNATKTRFGL